MSDQQVPPLLVDIVAACKELHVGKTKLFEIIAKGDLETIRIGRGRLVLRDSLEAYIGKLRAEQNA